MTQDDFKNTKWDVREWGLGRRRLFLNTMSDLGLKVVSNTYGQIENFTSLYVNENGQLTHGLNEMTTSCGRKQMRWQDFSRLAQKSIDQNSSKINPLGVFDDVPDLTPEQVPELSGGSKFDNEKPPMELLPPNGLIEVAKAMGHGAKKYNEIWPDMNWPKVKNARRRYLGAALRHIMARLGGEVRDPESGHLHVAHAAFCLLCVCEFDGEYREENK